MSGDSLDSTEFVFRSLYKRKNGTHALRSGSRLSYSRARELLLGLSKGNARVEIWASFFFFFFFFFVQPQFAIKSLIRMRDDLTLMCA